MAADDLKDLQDEWSEMYRKTLPSLARAKDPAQSRWPVSLDHCFARIILDNTVGKDIKQKGEYTQWDSVIKKPASRNMTKEQLTAAIALAQSIQNGKVDLQELDEISLRARGKNETKYGKKRKFASADEKGESTSTKRHNTVSQQSTLNFKRDEAKHRTGQESLISTQNLEKDLKTTSNPDVEKLLKRIRNHDQLTEYRKRLYATLLTVPAGQYTTYQAMAEFLNSSARAVGSGMRNNPFAPDVPCHRVLASDRSIGGFGGHWGKDGKHADKKLQLLKAEGVKFDSTGKVKGPVFTRFQELHI